MSARDQEAAMLDRCVAIVRNPALQATDAQQANVFRLAAMVLESRLPTASAALWRACQAYFTVHPEAQLHASEVIRQAWIISMPRLRDALSCRLSDLPSKAAPRVQRNCPA